MKSKLLAYHLHSGISSSLQGITSYFLSFYMPALFLHFHPGLESFTLMRVKNSSGRKQRRVSMWAEDGRCMLKQKPTGGRILAELSADTSVVLYLPRAFEEVFWLDWTVSAIRRSDERASPVSLGRFLHQEDGEIGEISRLAPCCSRFKCFSEQQW